MMDKRKLEVKVRKGQIHIGPADKWKGIVAMPLNKYEEMVKKNLEKTRRWNG